MVDRTGGDVLLDVLASEGVRHIFGNPGTTELPFLDALAGAPAFEYLLALHESVAVAMADGYAQVTHRPAFINLHTAPGLGNAIGTLANAQATRTPLVVTAGQQDRRHLLSEPFLSGDLVGLATPVTKWAREVHAVRDLGTTMRRAFHDAASTPSGPVFVSLPMDLFGEEVDEAMPAPTPIHRRTVPTEVEELAELVEQAPPGRLAIVAGDEVARSRAVEALVAVAETVGASVFGPPLHSNLVFPTAHPLWRGALPAEAPAIREILASFECVLLVGGRGFMTFPYRPGRVLPEGIRLVHLSPDPADLGRTYPAHVGVVGDPRATFEAMLPHLRTAVDATAVRELIEEGTRDAEARAEELDGRLLGRYATKPATGEVAAHAVVRSLPPETVVVEESPTADAHVRAFHRVTRPDRFFYSRGGGLGWGMAAALGISLGLEGEPVACIVGDGSTMYAPQALWSAARLDLPVLFVIFNNREYQILKRFMRAMDGRAVRTGSYPGLDITEPAVDFVGLARALGVPGASVGAADEIGDAVRAAMARGGPSVIEVPIE